MRRNNYFLAASIFILMGYSSGAFAFGSKSATTVETQGTQSLDTVWILRSDGGKSCSPETAQSIEAGAQELFKAKIRVLNSIKGDDGKMRMQMCGAPTGALNSYMIPRDALPQAIALGFQEAPKDGIKPKKK
ncbi:MAG: hypothetical protein AABZ55_14515 [Bdellovibrionota bacterium]